VALQMNKFNTSKRINMIFSDLFLSQCGLLADAVVSVLFRYRCTAIWSEGNLLWNRQALAILLSKVPDEGVMAS
jgi:hypothetical protein